MISCPRAHNVPAPNKTCDKLLIEETAKSWNWYCLMLLYNMMGKKLYRNGIMNAQLKWWAPVRSPPSMKASAVATRGITEAATVGIKNWYKRGQLPLSSSMQENKLLYSSASDIMAVKHSIKVPTPRTLWRRQPRCRWQWWPCPQSPWSCPAPCTCQRTCEGWWLCPPGGGPR